MAKLMINKNKKKVPCTGDLRAFFGTPGQMHL